MPIDWFTVVAQMVNFLILVGLLKRFLYGPVLAAVDAREKRIADELADAETKRTEAEKERDGYLEKSAELERRRHEMLEKAKEEAAAERRKLVDAAREESDAVRSRRAEALRQEHTKLRAEIARRTRGEVFAIARKALTDLAGAELEQRVCEVFAARLRELDDHTREALGNALRETDARPLLRSAFELSPHQQSLVRDALEGTIPPEAEIRYETTPELIGGIELIAGGHKVSWNIADYLAAMEESAGSLSETDGKPEEPKP